ncbi:serine/threonine-protein kinase [Kribbella amoyensis]|uniref:non-specific serine/threonine protein kinase n=1 Tax=Kribbella amoyensis TaxID=996641 RepID=A0A561BPT4_9ACTN|nr:serine/threonine-protein kinase [Kribbella amoyensis]TWD80866.1 serine/threonine-protein kinase [Kribbella amoyensis]
MPDVFAGRFELVDPAGSGGTGTVWRAWDRRLQRFCAAKVLRQRHAGALVRFVREQGLRLDHPHVLSPYSWAAEDDQALLAMDLVGGGSVSTLIADFGPLPERYAAELLRQLLEGLDHVHEAGLVHRDVKPANLLLEATGTGHPVLRLSDFGIALSLGEPRLTQQGAVVGTPGYLAPEALADEPPSPAQDLYAVGVTGWQLLTGAEPPVGGAIELPQDESSVLWKVVEGLLHPDPLQRTPSAADALSALGPTLEVALQIPAATADGELIEVFNHLPPLPPRYRFRTEPTPQPEPHPARHPEPSPEPQPEPQAQPSREPSPGPHAEPQAVPSPEPQPEPSLPVTGPTPENAPTITMPLPADSPTGDPAVGTSGDQRGRRRRVLLAGGGLVTLAAGVAAVLLLLDGIGNTPGNTPPPTSTPSPSVTPTVDNPARTETPAPNAEVTAGQSCGWQEAGEVETAADGTQVECRQQGSSYRWIKVA